MTLVCNELDQVAPHKQTRPHASAARRRPVAPHAVEYFAVILGITSAFWGILWAVDRIDLKQLLAYSTVENIGLIVLAFGVMLLGKRHGFETAATIALSAMLLHYDIYVLLPVAIAVFIIKSVFAPAFLGWVALFDLAATRDEPCSPSHRAIHAVGAFRIVDVADVARAER